MNWFRMYYPEDEARLKQFAAEDRHEVIAPTHIMEKDGDIVGYASIGAVPLVLPWFSTRKMLARDSLYFVNQMENHIAALLPRDHCGLICVPVVKDSPFQPHMRGLRYVDAGPGNIMFKKVKK